MRRVLVHPAAYLFYIAVLAYGLFLPWLGLYGDDWEFLHGYYRYGAEGFDLVVGWMRPYAVLVYRLLAPILGLNILAYHGYAFLARWLTGVLVWKLIRLLFPEHPLPALWVAGLFLIYPAFYQQTLPLSFSLHFTVQIMFLASLTLMLVSASRKGVSRIILRACSIAFAFSVFILEYFAGLELIRPVIIWFALREVDYKKRLYQTLITWLPYLGVQIFYLTWRIFFFKSSYQDPIIIDSFLASPALAFRDLLANIFQTLVGVVFSAWGSVFVLTQGKSGWIHLGLVGLTLAFSVFYFCSKHKYLAGAAPASPGPALIWIGTVALLVSGIPLWSSSLIYRQGFPGDRLSLPFLLGASLFWVGWVMVLVRWRHKATIIAIMISLAVGAHFLNANTFRRKADELRQYFWQITWRMPGLKPGTYLLSQEIPLGFYSDNNLTPLLLWTYAPEDRTANDPYHYLDVEIRAGSIIPELLPDAPVEHFAFKSTAGNAVVIYSTPSSCVRVLAPKDPLVLVPEELVAAVHLSNLDQIIPNPAEPAAPPSLLGQEPEHDWCYYFSKADLSRQMQDWRAIAALGDEAFNQGLGASSPAELYPFIYGYAFSHRLEYAWELSQIPKSDEKYVPSLCQAWETIKQNLSNEDEKRTAQRYFNRMSCSMILSDPCLFP